MEASKGIILDKAYPHDVNIEEAVLCALIIDPMTLTKFSLLFTPELFYKETNKIIAQSIYDLFKEGKPIDTMTVIHQCHKHNKEVKAYDVSIIVNKLVTSTNLESHFKILVEFYIRRELLKRGMMLQIQSTDLSIDVFKILSETTEKVTKLNNMTIFEDSYDAHDAMQSLVEHIVDRKNTKDKYRKTGLEDLDKYIYLDKGDLICIAAGAGCGKSKLVMKMTKELMKNYEDVAIQYYSFEDPVNSILKNWIAEDVMLSTQEMDSKGYQLTDGDERRIKKEIQFIKNKDFKIINNPCYIDDIKSSFVNFCQHRDDKFNILIIDNVMLLKDNNNKKGSNDNAIDEHIANTIKRISVETLKYNSCIIFLHHFTKEALSNTKLKNGFIPSRDNVRGSTRYIDISLTALLLNKPSIHPELIALYPGYEEMLNDILIINVDKNRNGPTGSIRYFNDMKYNIFEPLNNEKKVKNKK